VPAFASWLSCAAPDLVYLLPFLPSLLYQLGALAVSAYSLGWFRCLFCPRSSLLFFVSLLFGPLLLPL
jgi:hypothetical protein